MAPVRSLKRLLQNHFSVISTCDEEDFLSFARSYEHDLIIVDAPSADTSGPGFVAALRASGVETPVIVVAESFGPQKRARVFEAGADDCIERESLYPRELTSRARAVICRSRRFAERTLQVANLSLNCSERTVTVAGAKLRLSRRSYRMLEHLMLRHGKLVTHESLMNAADISAERDREWLRVRICNLRKSLACTNAAVSIVTEHDLGYRLVADGAAKIQFKIAA